MGALSAAFAALFCRVKADSPVRLRDAAGPERAARNARDHRCLALRLRIFATELKLWRSCRGRGAQRRPQEDVDELAEQLEDDELARREDLHLVCDRLEVVRLVLVEA